MFGNHHVEESMTTLQVATLSDRLRLLLQEKTEGSRRFKWLEEQTGIPATNWTNWYHGRQRATEEMIQGIARLFPEHAFWLATGITDWTHGHICPRVAAEMPNRVEFDHPAATRYFRQKLSEIHVKEESDPIEYERIDEGLFFTQYERNLEHQKLIEAYLRRNKRIYDNVTQWTSDFDPSGAVKKYDGDKED